MEAILKSEEDIESIEWIKLPLPGCTIKILGRNKETGAFGALFKMEPGAELLNSRGMVIPRQNRL